MFWIFEYVFIRYVLSTSLISKSCLLEWKGLFNGIWIYRVLFQDVDEREEDIKLMREELEEAQEREKAADVILKVRVTRYAT